jgi:soluble lytic murein transglycosylase-like protein
MSPRWWRFLPVVAGLALSWSWGAGAAERVTFVDGRSLVVESHRNDGAAITLELEGGGEITIPAGRIRSILLFDEKEDQQFEEPPIQFLAKAGAAATPAASKAPADNPPDGRKRAPEVDLSEPDTLFPSIAELALKYGLDTQLVAAVALVESSLDPDAISPKGAQGLMQLMPATASAYGVEDPFDALENLEAGIAHLKKLLNRYDGDLELALAGYNAGEGAVARYGGVPPFPETIRYVDRVMALARAR